MKNLKVGDRVRVVDDGTIVSRWKSVIGKEAKIIQHGEFFLGCEWVICFDDGHEMEAATSMLEPITPISTWEEFQQVTGIDIRKPVEKETTIKSLWRVE